MTCYLSVCLTFLPPPYPNPLIHPSYPSAVVWSLGWLALQWTGRRCPVRSDCRCFSLWHWCHSVEEERRWIWCVDVKWDSLVPVYTRISKAAPSLILTPRDVIINHHDISRKEPMPAHSCCCPTNHNHVFFFNWDSQKLKSSITVWSNVGPRTKMDWERRRFRTETRNLLTAVGLHHSVCFSCWNTQCH